MLPPLAAATVVIGLILTQYECEAAGNLGVCNIIVQYTYIDSRTTVTSYTTQRCCGLFSWCWETCDDTSYRTTVTYYATTGTRTVFGCCAGYYQPSPLNQSCIPLCKDGQIMLAGGSASNEGTIQLCVNSTWGSVCDNHWSAQDATVACKQLGFSKYGAVAYGNNHFGGGIGRTVLKDVGCTGSEAKLADCMHSNNTSGCTHSNDVGVYCNSAMVCRSGNIRLLGGTSPYKGRVEVCIDEDWRTICGDSWDQEGAMVVCRQLGYLQYNYTAPAGLVVSSAYYSKVDNISVFVSTVQCHGNETNLLGCAYNLRGIHDYCNSTTDAGVNCQQCKDGELQLVGPTSSEGRVEVCERGQWGQICEDGWDTYDASVVCRQLGYTVQGSMTTEGFLYGISTYPLLWTNLTCVGNESKLSECKMQDFWSLGSCNSAGVSCNPSYPGAPQNASADVLNSTSIAVSWSSPSVEYGAVLQYNLSCRSPVLTSSRSLSSNTTRQQMTGLLPYTTYNCCVWALNSHGWGPGACIQVTTPPSVLTQYPANYSVYVVNSTSIVLKWSPPVLGRYNGPLLNYSIEITSQGNTSQMFLFSTVLTLSSLHPFYNYTCTVAAYTAAGKGPSTPPITVTTLQDVPSGPPIRFKVSAVGPTSITMEWRPPEQSQQNGIIIRYTVAITTVITGRTQRMNTTNTSITVGLLKPYSAYICSVSASTAIGSGPQASPITVRTMEGAPTGPPLALNHSTPNPSTLLLTWSPPDPSYRNGVLRGYMVVITQLETPWTQHFNTSAPPLSIPSLHPFYTYNCTVSAYTVGLPGPYSPPYLVRMPQSVPTSPPLNLSLVASTSTSVTLSWTPPPTPNQNGVITGYTIQVSGSQQVSPRETNISSNGGTVDSLHPDTTYLFRVAAMTAVGRGPYSDNMYVTTKQFVPLISPNVSLPVRISADTILLSWEPMSHDTIDGALIGYYVRYRPVTAVAKRGTNQDYTIISTTQTQITISTLDPTSAYVVGVAAVTQAGIGVYSENTVGLYENSVFQVYMEAPGVVCTVWMPYSTSDKTKDILSQISSYLGSSFPITYIGNAGLLCDKQHPTWVVLTGRAIGTQNLNSSGMLYQLQEWVLTSPKVTSQGVVLQILINCPVYLTQLQSPGCTVAMPTTATPQATPSPIPPVAAAQGNTELTSVVSVSAGIGGVLLVLVLVVAAMILYVRRKTRATFIVGRVAGVNETFKEMECIKETATDEHIYASITEMNGSQHRESAFAQNCVDPLPTGDELVVRALPNPYASFLFEGSSEKEDAANADTTANAHTRLTSLDDCTLSTDPPLDKRSEQATYMTVAVELLDHVTLPYDQADHMTLPYDQVDHMTLPCDQVDHMIQVLQEALKQDQANSDVGGILATNDAVAERGDTNSCDETNTNLGNVIPDSASNVVQAMPILEDDYIEMKPN